MNNNQALLRLRRDTAALHSGIEKTVELDTLIQPPIDVSRYSNLLNTHWQMHLDLASILANLPDQCQPAGWNNDEQLHALRDDLAELGREVSPKVSPDLSANLSTRAATGALGWIYVMEGASHGNLQILAALRKDKTFSHLDCTSYFALGADRLRQNWPAVVAAIDGLAPQQVDSTIQGAIESFQHFGKIWSKLP